MREELTLQSRRKIAPCDIVIAPFVRNRMLNFEPRRFLRVIQLLPSSLNSMRLRFFTSVCSMILLAVTVQGQGHIEKYSYPSVQMPTVDSFIRAEMAKNHIPAMAVSVIKDGRIIFEEGYGLADSEIGIKAAPNTPFYTASITKAFTGTALIILEAQHKIDLDRINRSMIIFIPPNFVAQCGMCQVLQSGESQIIPGD